MSVTDFPRISLIRDFSNLLFGYKRIIYERRQDTSNRSGATETKSIAHFLVLVHVHVTVIREVRTQSRQMKPSIRVGRWLFFKNVQQWISVSYSFSVRSFVSSDKSGIVRIDEPEDSNRIGTVSLIRYWNKITAAATNKFGSKPRLYDTIRYNTIIRWRERIYYQVWARIMMLPIMTLLRIILWVHPICTWYAQVADFMDW